MRYWKTRKVAGNPTVGLAAASFLAGPDAARRRASLLGLVASLQAQTWADWRLLVVHDGPTPADADTGRLLDLVRADVRVRWEAREHKGQFGHPHRQWAVGELASTCAWIGLTNDDNYYAPVYFEWLLSAATAVKSGCDFVFCNLIHSHKLWRPLTAEVRRGKIDLGGWLAKAALCKRTKFDNFGFAGDWDYIQRLTAQAKGVVKVDGYLFVHN